MSVTEPVSIRTRSIILDDMSALRAKSGKPIQIRIPVKPQPRGDGYSGGWRPWPKDDSPLTFDDVIADVRGGKPNQHCPYGQRGDQLAVKETWAIWNSHWTDYGWEGNGIVEMASYAKRPESSMHSKYGVVYRCDRWYDAEPGERWRSPTIMPQWASRTTLTIDGIGVEGLCNIMGSDAHLAGFEDRMHFASSWNLRYEERGLGWSKNPWVWVIDAVGKTP